MERFTEICLVQGQLRLQVIQPHEGSPAGVEVLVLPQRDIIRGFSKVLISQCHGSADAVPHLGYDHIYSL